MEWTSILLLVGSIQFMSCAKFGFDNDFFEDLDGGDKHLKSSFFDESESENDSVFLSESTNKMNDGREMITRESEAMTTDPVSGKSIMKKTTKHFVRYQNGTVIEVDNEGSGEDGSSSDRSTKVECITEDDCKDNFFCDRLSFSCKMCLSGNETCHAHRECCDGFWCRDGKCQMITGKEDDPCENDKDCKPNHCCAYVEGKDVCKPHLEEGETCGDEMLMSPRFPSFFSRKFIENSRRSRCPCLKGLECRKRHSYFLMEPKMCTHLRKRVTKKKAKKVVNKRRKGRPQKREEIEDEHEIIEDEDDDDDDDEDDDDEDQERNEAVIRRLPNFLRGLFESFFN